MAKDDVGDRIGQLDEDRRRLLEELRRKAQKNAAPDPNEPAAGAAPPGPPPGGFGSVPPFGGFWGMPPPFGGGGGFGGIPPFGWFGGMPPPFGGMPGAGMPGASPAAGPHGGNGAESPLQCLRPGGDGAPLYIVHAIFGSVFPYHKLAMHLAPGRPVFGIRARGLEDGLAPRDDVREMAEAYAQAILADRPKGALHIAGYSFGAWVAYAIAELLARKGRRPGLCGMLGVSAPISAVAPMVGQQMDAWVSGMMDSMKLMRNLAMSNGQQDPTAWFDQVPPFQRLLLAHNVAALRYVPTQSDLPLDLLVTPEQEPFLSADRTLGWSTVSTGEIREHRLSGNHLAMFEEPQVAQLAEVLDARMAAREAG
ncbi:MAG TPA: alpha/beta fold hydrolase [Myxococcaceae bacterium]|jgi:thioesterase domain-containing protein